MRLHPDFIALNQPKYDNVKIGDRVFSPVYGHGKVIYKNEDDHTFRVKFDDKNEAIWFFHFDKAGKIEWRLLFWDAPAECWPKAPKRKVKKVCWLNIDADGCKTTFNSEEEANENAYADRIACVRVEYEVEE